MTMRTSFFACLTIIIVGLGYLLVIGSLGR